ncbi:MAG: helix-turn-helix domain-containing protein [Fimbriimonas sp.]
MEITDPVVRLTPDPSRIDTLSNREKEVLALASAGYVDKWIAARMGVTGNTLRTYWNRIRTKLGEVPRTALVAAYVEDAMGGGEAATQTIPIDAEWYIDLDRDTYRLIAPFSNQSDLISGQEVTVEWVLDQMIEPAGTRLRRLVESARQGRLFAFHVVASMRARGGTELVNALCVVQRDEGGRPIGIYGCRVPSMDLRGEEGAGQGLGQWGLTLPQHTFWADRDCRAIFQIEAADSNPYGTLVSRLFPEDRPRFDRLVTQTINSEVPLNRLAFRLDIEGASERWVMMDSRIERVGRRRQLVVGVMPLT